MLVFLTTVRHPANSNDFGRVLRLLEGTLASVCNQKDEGFEVIVVCNERPSIAFDHPKVHYHIVDFPPPSALRRADTGMDALKRDKGTKLMAGVLAARGYEPDYFFIFDADDLVSDRLSAFANSNPGLPGWYVDAGYSLDFRTGRVQRRHGMVRYCGTTLMPNAAELLRLSRAPAELSEFASQQELLDATSFRFIDDVLGNHVHMVPYFQAHGLKMAAIPFHASVWVLNTGENHTGTNAEGGLPPTESFCREFGLPPRETADAAAIDWLRESFVCMRSAIGAKVSFYCARQRAREWQQVVDAIKAGE